MFGHPERKFYFSLAKELGMPVREMLQRISSKELTEWIAYSNIERVEFQDGMPKAQQKLNQLRHR